VLIAPVLMRGTGTGWSRRYCSSATNIFK